MTNGPNRAGMKPERKREAATASPYHMRLCGACNGRIQPASQQNAFDRGNPAAELRPMVGTSTDAKKHTYKQTKSERTKLAAWASSASRTRAACAASDRLRGRLPTRQGVACFLRLGTEASVRSARQPQTAAATQPALIECKKLRRARASLAKRVEPKRNRQQAQAHASERAVDGAQ